MLSGRKKDCGTQQLYDDLVRRIVTGAVAPGAPLPTFPELMAHYGVSRGTVNTVIRRLAAEKFIRTRTSRPALVTARLPKKRYAIALLSTLSPELEAEFNYESSAWGWTLHKTVIAELMKQNHSCISLSLVGDYARAEKFIDGIVLIGAAAPELERVAALGKPTVNVIGEYGMPGTVSFDRSEAMTQCALYFLSRGVRTVAALGIEPEVRHGWHRVRTQCFDRTLFEHGFPAAALHAFPADTSIAGGAELMRRLLAMRPELPLGVVTASDWVAKGVLDVARASGLGVKKDVFIIGGTGLKETEHWNPALSVYGTPFEAVGKAVGELIIRTVETRTVQPPVFVKNKLMIRET